jgi:hypothetical protein
VSVFLFGFLLVCFFPVWVPVLIAIVGHREPTPVRVVLASAGVLAGCYAAFVSDRFERARASGRGFDEPDMFFLPFRTAALSFYLAFTGVCLVAALSYVPSGGLLSAPGMVATLLFVSALALGAFSAGWFFAWPD